MKKKCTLGLLFMSIWTQSIVAQRIDTVTVGKNQFAISGNTYSFFQTVEAASYWNRSVYIYPRQALKGMPQNAEITAFRLFRDVTRVSSVVPVEGRFPPNATTPAKIWMTNTRLDEWGDSLKLWSAVHTTLRPTLVFEGDIKQFVDTSTGWKTFPLMNTTFRYDSTQNLAIMIEYSQDLATNGMIYWAYDSTSVKLGDSDTTNYFNRLQFRFCHKLFSRTPLPVDSFTGSNIRHPHIKFLYKAKPNLIFEQKENSNFKVYPNPTSDVLMVELNDLQQNFVLKIVDMMGKVHYLKSDFELNQGSAIPIEVGSLPKGAYFLMVEDGQSNKVRPFFKLD